MSEHGYLTPDEIPVETVCRALFIPNDQLIIAAVNGALLELVFPYNWEEYGVVTPAEITEALLPFILDFMGSGCMLNVDHFWQQQSQGAAGGGITANTNTEIPFNQTAAQNAGNVTLSSNHFTVAPGLYFVEMSHILRCDVAYLAMSWLAETTGGDIVLEGERHNQPANVQADLKVSGLLNVTEETSYTFYARSNDTRATDAFGVAYNLASRVEIYGFATFTRLGEAS